MQFQTRGSHDLTVKLPCHLKDTYKLSVYISEDS